MFCYPVDLTNLELAQPMAEAIAKFSFGYFHETDGAISPHVYWCDGEGRLALLFDTVRRQSFHEPFVQLVTASSMAR